MLNSGDTAWILTATALVMMMTAPGLALFYGGLVRRENVLSTLMHSFFMLCLVSVVWVVFGYSLAFGSSFGGVIGRLDYLVLIGVGADPIGSATIPHLLFAMYQGMFAVITVALISGAVAERINFKAYLLFTLLWSSLIYPPLAHWVWGGGWLQQIGALDFAGGTVVHISSGFSALVAAIMIGKRSVYPQGGSQPHNVTYVLIGGGLLWFGWFGFNAGSALAANGLAALALATTHTSAAAGGLVWATIEGWRTGKVSVVGAVSGAVAGLVGITPAAGFVTIPSALAVGIGAGAICYCGVNLLKARFGYDDALDVFGVHGLGGAWGALATGLFATKTVNPAGADGLFYGNPGLLIPQIVGVLAAAAFSAAGTCVILKLISLITPLRVSRKDELAGLDGVLHGEIGYGYGLLGADSTAD